MLWLTYSESLEILQWRLKRMIRMSTFAAGEHSKAAVLTRRSQIHTERVAHWYAQRPIKRFRMELLLTSISTKVHSFSIQKRLRWSSLREEHLERSLLEDHSGKINSRRPLREDQFERTTSERSFLEDHSWKTVRVREGLSMKTIHLESSWKFARIHKLRNDEPQRERATRPLDHSATLLFDHCWATPPFGYFVTTLLLDYSQLLSCSTTRLWLWGVAFEMRRRVRAVGQLESESQTESCKSAGNLALGWSGRPRRASV